MKRVIWVNTFTCEPAGEGYYDFYLLFDMPMTPGLGLTIQRAYKASPLCEAVQVFVIDTEADAELWEVLSGWRHEDRIRFFGSPKKGRDWVLEKLGELTLLVSADGQWWCW